MLLFGASQSVGDALLIMLNLPFALIGGTLGLWLWHSNFNISAAVGYIAVFGVSVLNGVVLVSSIRQAMEEGLPVREAIVRGCEIRFRPIVVSGIVAVIGGLLSSTALTLLVLPAIYTLLARRVEHREATAPVP
jgi:cobalt-zinc-cadmium resistance protein CzcA